MSELQKIDSQEIIIDTKNKIGCGDVFGATFFYHYLSTNNLELSLLNANKAGAVSASIQNLSSLERIHL